MNSHDFCLWLKGYLAACDGLNIDDMERIEEILDNVCDDAPKPYEPPYVPTVPTPSTPPWAPGITIPGSGTAVPYPPYPPTIT